LIPLRYQEALSDIAGSDPQCHHKSVIDLITIIRNWISSNQTIEAELLPTGSAIDQIFKDFIGDFEILKEEKKISPKDEATMPKSEVIRIMKIWCKSR
jgi:hypothetical protein